MPSDYDPLVKIAFDLTPRNADFDKTSFIFPLTPTAETWEEDGQFSTKLEIMESMKKFSGSSLLLEAPQKVRKSESLRRKGDHIEPSSSGHLQRKADDSDNSGYLNFIDAQNECESSIIQNRHRVSTFSAEELMLSDPSLRDSAQSPELHILSIGSDTTENIKDSSPPLSESHEQESRIVQASNPAFEFMDHRSLSPQEDSHQEKDSGFPVEDSGYPLSKDSNVEMGSSNGGSASNLGHGCSHLTVEDSGFPLDDSSSPLLPGKDRVLKVVTADSGYPIEEENQVNV